MFFPALSFFIMIIVCEYENLSSHFSSEFLMFLFSMIRLTFTLKFLTLLVLIPDSPSCASRKFLDKVQNMERRTTAGEFEGGGEASLRGSAKRRGGSLTPSWKCPVSLDDLGKEFLRRDTRRSRWKDTARQYRAKPLLLICLCYPAS